MSWFKRDPSFLKVSIKDFLTLVGTNMPITIPPDNPIKNSNILGSCVKAFVDAFTFRHTVVFPSNTDDITVIILSNKSKAYEISKINKLPLGFAKTMSGMEDIFKTGKGVIVGDAISPTYMCSLRAILNIGGIKGKIYWLDIDKTEDIYF